MPMLLWVLWLRLLVSHKKKPWQGVRVDRIIIVQGSTLTTWSRGLNMAKCPCWDATTSRVGWVMLNPHLKVQHRHHRCGIVLREVHSKFQPGEDRVGSFSDERHSMLLFGHHPLSSFWSILLGLVQLLESVSHPAQVSVHHLHHQVHIVDIFHYRPDLPLCSFFFSFISRSLAALERQKSVCLSVISFQINSSAELSCDTRPQSNWSPGCGTVVTPLSQKSSVSRWDRSWMRLNPDALSSSPAPPPSSRPWHHNDSRIFLPGQPDASCIVTCVARLSALATSCTSTSATTTLIIRFGSDEFCVPVWPVWGKIS